MKEWTIQLIRWMRKYYFHLGVGALIAIRCFHLGSEIDSPHDWRQCDTAHYIRDFYRNGIDPDSSADGMEGGDFSNGFTMGGIAQLYQANSIKLSVWFLVICLQTCPHWYIWCCP